MKIRKILALIAVTPLFFNVYAQTADDMGKIALSVVMPDNIDGLTVSQLSKLESKVIQIVTKAASRQL
jgi:hypothetical protein